MPRTTLVPKAPHNLRGATAPGAAALSFVGGNASEGYDCPLTGKETFLVRNTDDEPQTVTFKSVGESKYNRTGDLGPYSVPVGGEARFGPFPIDGWRQTNGRINIDTSDDTVEIAALRS